jgi:hypothetical protein
MNPTTQIFPRTARQSGTEYAASIERKRRSNIDGIVIAGSCIAAVVIVYAWLWSGI